MKLPRPAQYFNIYWGAGETTGKKSPFRNYSAGSTSKV